MKVQKPIASDSQKGIINQLLLTFFPYVYITRCTSCYHICTRHIWGLETLSYEKATWIYNAQLKAKLAEVLTVSARS